MDTDNYTKTANCQLSNENNYKILQTNHTLQHNKMVNDTLDQFKNDNLLSKKTAEGLKIINPRIPKFYITPKTHKENELGRPVINSVDYHTYQISRFVDHHLQPLAKEIQSYINDTNDFANKKSNFKVLENSFLVTVDVKALFINKHTKQRSYCCCKTRTQQLHKENRSHKSDKTFLALILKLNNFIFNSKFYLQIKGNNMCPYICKHIHI